MGGALRRVSASSVLLLLAGGAQAAETGPVGLDYVVAAGVQRCPTREEFEALLAREVGGDPFATNPALGVHVELTPRSNGVSGVVEITENGEQRGRRELRSGDCAALAAALALVVGVELDPLALAQRAKVTPTVAPPEVQVAVPTEQPRQAPDWYFALGGLVAVGLAPTVAPAVTVSAAIRPHGSALEFALEFQGMPPVTAPLGPRPGSGSVSHLLGNGLACVRPWWFLGFCGLLTGGVAIASGGTPSETQTTEGYAAAGLRFPFLEIRPGDPDLRVVPHFDVAYQITREPLQAQNGTTLWAPTLFTLSFGIMLQGRIL
jgi:hypothetical protein